MFNRTEYGVHHPGNIVPCCRSCNKRERKVDRSFTNRVEHLEIICESRNEHHLISKRKRKIEKSIKDERYPNLSNEEQHAIRVIANSLYKQLEQAFVNK
jgi:hypothetical protein